MKVLMIWLKRLLRSEQQIPASVLAKEGGPKTFEAWINAYRQQLLRKRND